MVYAIVDVNPLDEWPLDESPDNVDYTDTCTILWNGKSMRMGLVDQQAGHQYRWGIVLAVSMNQ
jgi:hypothetical protein